MTSDGEKMGVSDIFLDCGDMAMKLGITERHLQRLAKSGALPKLGRDQFAAIETCAAFIRYLRIHGPVASSERMDDVKQRERLALADKHEAEARIAELTLAEKRGDLHRSEHVRQIMTDTIVSTRSRFLALPSKIGAKVPEKMRVEITEYVRELINEALESLAHYDPEQFRQLNESYVGFDDN